jgi:hypothetical protein
MVERGQPLEKRDRFVVIPLDNFGVDSAQSPIDKVKQRVTKKVYSKPKIILPCMQCDDDDDRPL